MTTRRRRKYRPEEVVAKLRDADAMFNAGKDPAAVLQAVEISKSTLDEKNPAFSVAKKLLGTFK